MDVTTGALSPLDGRYAPEVEVYARSFSEDALFRERFTVEIEWFLALSNEPGIAELSPIADATAETLRRWETDFGPADAARIREIERKINHDVKAVEYYLKERLAEIGFGSEVEFVHFGATSEDVNNLAYSLMLRHGLETGWLPAAEELIEAIWALAETTAAMPMPSHTHGQPASPTTMGKELAVFAYRMDRQVGRIRSTPLLGKFNGAVGTYAADVVAYPDVDWIGLSKRFVEGFGLEWNPLTTQVEPHDAIAEVFHGIVRMNSIVLDFCRDTWEYISRGYLAQRPVEGEVGSSTMPHKVNPIAFENAEANVGVSTALLEHLATKLAVSRMQRDLSDSSAIRNMGTAVAHSGLALTVARRGLARVSPSPEKMASELEEQWEVLAEPIQTVMRRHGKPEPYEQLKLLTRGVSVSPEEVRTFIASLGLPPEAEKRLLELTPTTYTGLAAELVLLGRRATADEEAS